MSDQEAGEKRKAGGQPGNTNSTHHGGRSRRPGLALGDWGKQFGNLRQQALRYRKRLLTEVEKIRGTVSPIDEERIVAAASLEMARRIAQRELSREGITATERLAILQKVTNFTLQRLQIVQRLGIDGNDGSQSADDPASIYQSDPSDPA